MTMTREEAMERFKNLVNRYGLQWTASVPKEAHIELAEINKVLTEADRREALGLDRQKPSRDNGMALWKRPHRSVKPKPKA